ncbi:phospholipase/carboxylesterase [Flavobacterium fryxellicola]|uniref:Phospholipase n=2 Tax=Flavobacterium fryxellicola TaxID=249352 RepID=A0A167WDZ8_9FLAO|nr:alpha/beta fold hydrolase [Flavobacterium fryxellicola]OAB27274.1 phospholipase [Flavobacterium fryxellicola]SHN67183.1 phospholipase/carboxylesterase [Flavobacterium fryxellicola]
MNLSLEYKIREPKVKLDKNPLLLLLHGYGSNEADLFSFAAELPDEYYVISARAPYDMQYGSYAWYAINFDADQNKFSDHDQAKVSRDLIAGFIDELIQTYPIDPEKVTLIGFSQGSILSYAVALSYPEKVQKVVAMSGYLNLEIVSDDYLKNTFNNLKIFASHGTSDQVIPVAWARKTPAILENLGIDITYKEYPIGHGVAPQNFYDFKNWLVDHT